MADLPFIKKPYNNISTPSGQESEADIQPTPKGPEVGKQARAALVLQGLIGAK